MRGSQTGKGVEMKGRPDIKRIAQLKRRCHKIFAMYDPDPDNFWLQHAIIRDMGVREHGAETRVEYEAETTRDS